MSILIKGVEMPKKCDDCFAEAFGYCRALKYNPSEPNFRAIGDSMTRRDECPLIEIKPHGDLIDRDALMKDGWLSLWKRVDYMGGYAIHDLPLINPSIPVVLESEGEDG